MAQSLVITTTAVDGIDTVTHSVEYVADALLKLDVVIPDGTANQIVIGAVDVSNVVAMVIGSDQDVTLSTNGTDEIQTISTSGTVSGGTFPLTYDGQTVTGIAWNASAADVQTALVTLSNIAPGDVACAGGPLPGTPVTVTFQGNLAATNVPQMTTSSASLTGGGTIAVATTTAGVAATSPLDLAASEPIVHTEDSIFAAPFGTDIARFLVSNDSGASATLTIRVLTDS